MKKLFCILLLTVLAAMAGCQAEDGPAAVAGADPQLTLPTAGPDALQATESPFLAGEEVQTESPQTQPTDDNLTHDTKIGPISGDIVEISERLFVAQTNDIYINTDDYWGKTIKYEGLFLADYWEVTGATYYYVLRYGPGCCGFDDTAGFEVRWDGEWPEENDWCEAIGTLEAYEEDGNYYLRLNLSSLTVLEERGAEYVAT